MFGRCMDYQRFPARGQHGSVYLSIHFFIHTSIHPSIYSPIWEKGQEIIQPGELIILMHFLFFLSQIRHSFSQTRMMRSCVQKVSSSTNLISARNLNIRRRVTFSLIWRAPLWTHLKISKIIYHRGYKGHMFLHLCRCEHTCHQLPLRPQPTGSVL